MEKIINRFTGEVMLGGISLKVVLERHKQWLNDEEGGSRADLRAADLRDADLRDANLRDANLSCAILRDANLSCAILRGANLSCADLRGADLRGANLRDADLRCANLSCAILRGADLRDADLSDANLSCAILRGADLSCAILRGADLRGADLRGADLRGANLRCGLEGVPFIENIHQKIYEAASKDGALDMSTWHQDGNVCGTTHCRAGWVIALAGDGGRALEWAMGTPAAAAIIYLRSDPNIKKIPDFYCENAVALADMKRLADLEAGLPDGGVE